MKGHISFAKSHPRHLTSDFVDNCCGLIAMISGPSGPGKNLTAQSGAKRREKTLNAGSAKMASTGRVTPLASGVSRETWRQAQGPRKEPS